MIFIFDRKCIISSLNREKLRAQCSELLNQGDKFENLAKGDHRPNCKISPTSTCPRKRLALHKSFKKVVLEMLEGEGGDRRNNMEALRCVQNSLPKSSQSSPGCDKSNEESLVSDVALYPTGSLSASRIPPPPSGYHIRDDNSLNESGLDSDSFCIDRFISSQVMGPNGKLKKTPCMLMKSQGLFLKGKSLCFMRYRQTKLNLPRNNISTGIKWSKTANDSMFYYSEQERKNTSENKSRNNSSLKFKNYSSDKVALRRNLHCLVFRKERNIKSNLMKHLIKYTSSSDNEHLDKNSNAQHSDNDLDGCARDKKAVENNSVTSILSADVFYSTKSEMKDEAEDHSVTELVDKALDSPHFEKSRSPNESLKDMEVKFPAESGAGMMEDVNQESADVQITKPCEEGISKSKKMCTSGFACLFPSKGSSECMSDRIDSVVFDCMRNALNEEISHLEKKEPCGKPPVGPDEHMRMSLIGHKKRDSVIRPKGNSPKKSANRLGSADNKTILGEELGNTTQPISKSAIGKLNASKETINLKSSSSSTPNLPSSVDSDSQPQTGTVPAVPNSAQTNSDVGSSSVLKVNKAKHGENVEREDGDKGEHDSDMTKNGEIGKDAHESTVKELHVDDPDTKSVSKIKSSSRRGRSPRKKLMEVSNQVTELASILVNSRTGDSPLSAEGSHSDGMKSAHLGRLKKSMSLSPQGTNLSKKLFREENCQSASQGNIAESSEKPKPPKCTKKSSKKKRVRIAVADDSPSTLRRKPSSISPANVVLHEEKKEEVVMKKRIKKKKAALQTEKSELDTNDTTVNEDYYIACDNQDCRELEFPKDNEEPQEVQDPIVVPICTDVPDVEVGSETSIELRNNTRSPEHVIFETAIQKTSNDKVPTTKRTKTKKTKQSKVVQPAEPTWSTNHEKTEKPKVTKPKPPRKMYKLTKAVNKSKKTKDETKNTCEITTKAPETDIDLESTQKADAIINGVDTLVPQKRSGANLTKKDYRTNFLHNTDSLTKWSNRRPPLSPKSNQINSKPPNAGLSQESILSDAFPTKDSVENTFGSSVDRRGPEIGSSVDAPVNRRDLQLRQTKSGPAVGLGRFGSKDSDIAARRVKFVRENASHLNKQGRKIVPNPPSPSFAPMASPVKEDALGGARVKGNDDQVSPVACKSTDLDLAAGFKCGRSPLRAMLASRQAKRDKAVKSAPKQEMRTTNDGSCSLPVSRPASSPQVIPTCDNSLDYVSCKY